MVQVTAETRIRGGACRHIQNKAKVEVSGTVTGNVVTASSITIVDKADDDDDDDDDDDSRVSTSNVPGLR